MRECIRDAENVVLLSAVIFGINGYCVSEQREDKRENKRPLLALAGPEWTFACRLLRKCF